MKKLHTIALGLLAIITTTSNAQITKTDSVTMGSGYKNEVYYSLKNGYVDTAVVKNWDIAFSAPGNFDGRFYGVMVNHSNGILVYAYPKSDVSGWASFDTSGWKNWNVHYNTDTAWYSGAFNRGAESHPRYGWGVYGPSGEIHGDSIYMIATVSGPTITPFKKLLLDYVKSSAGVKTWQFKYADIDGSNEQTVNLNTSADYKNRNFAYYSLRNNVALNREPADSTWDFVQTRYFALQPDGKTYYQTTGILTNYGVTVAQTAKVDLATVDYKDYAGEYVTNMSEIGYDWKTFNMSTFKYEIEDSTAYFIKDRKGDIYKIVFNSFSSSNGKTVFNLTRVFHDNTSVKGLRNSISAVYPNPANESVTVLVDDKNISAYEIADMTGKVVAQNKLNENGFVSITVPVAELPTGVYTIRVQADGQTYFSKFIKN